MIQRIDYWYSRSSINSIRHFKSMTTSKLQIQFSWCEKYLPFSKASEPNLSASQPPVRWLMKSLCLELKRSGLEIKHLPPLNANIANRSWCNSSSVFLHGEPFTEMVHIFLMFLNIGVFELKISHLTWMAILNKSFITNWITTELL
jgi:hypothetical protein